MRTTTYGSIMTTVSGILDDTGFSSTDGITSDRTLVINGTAVANSQVAVFLNGVSLGTTTATGTGDWSYDLSATALMDGNYAFTAQATEPGGAVTALSAAFDVSVDTLAPASVVVGPAPNIDVGMPTLTLNQSIQGFGIYPFDGGGSSFDAIGNIRTFGFNFEPNLDAKGDLLSIASNPALFSLVGTTYGGDGETTFGLPDLDGKLAVGTGTGPGLAGVTIGQAFGNDVTTLTQSNLPAQVGGSSAPTSTTEDSLGVRYMVVTEGLFPSGIASSPMIGQIMAVSTVTPVPSGMMEANGQLLSIASNTALFSILGTTYGGGWPDNLCPARSARPRSHWRRHRTGPVQHWSW